MTAQAGDTTSLSSHKAALRKAVRQQRRVLPRAERRRAAQRAAEHLARACHTWQARNVALYLSLAEEIDTAPLIRRLLRQRCALFVPRIGADRTLRFVQLAARTVLRPNRYGILEPPGAPRAPRLDLIVLPLVAFDAQGRRLGMGGGYYDRMLARSRAHRRPLRVGLAFALQELRAVPADARDARLDAVVTELGMRRFR